MSQTIGLKIKSVELVVAPRCSGKTEYLLKFFANFYTNNSWFFSPYWDRAREATDRLRSITMDHRPAKNILPFSEQTIRSERPTEFMFFDDYFEFNIKKRREIYEWIDMAAEKPVRLFVAGTPQKIHDARLVRAVKKLKTEATKIPSGFKRKNIEDLYYNFLTDDFTTIERNKIYRAPNIKQSNGLSQEQFLAEELGVYEGW